MGDFRGVLYIAFGSGWIDEARRSMTSLRRVSDLPIAVVTDSEWLDDPKPEYFVIRENTRGFASKPRHMFSCSPFEQTLFLDTDTLVLSAPDLMFGLLDHYDIGVRFGGPMLRDDPSLEFHTQCNSGVMLFKKSLAVAELFGAWNTLYVEAAVRLPVEKDSRGLNDQRTLSVAIARSKARPVHLAEYLNFALFETICTYSPVVVLHGRGRHLREIGESINENWDPRTDWQSRLWLQNIKGILPRGVRRSDPLLALGLVLRRIANELGLRLRKFRGEGRGRG